jgi:hypothetical protein
MPPLGSSLVDELPATKETAALPIPSATLKNGSSVSSQNSPAAEVTDAEGGSVRFRRTDRFVATKTNCSSIGSFKLQRFFGNLKVRSELRAAAFRLSQEQKYAELGK